MSHRVLALAALGAVTAAAPATAQEPGRTITLKARSQLERAHLVDNPPVGPSVGDQLIFNERLLDRRGRRIGRDSASCVRLFGERSLCTGVYTLPGGRITVQLLQPRLTGTVTYDQSITGGTGRYAGARGTVTVAQRPSGDRFTFRIRLSR